MKKSEIYSEIIDKVCDICEVRRESMINGVRFESVVDARVLAIQAMRRVGLTNEDIALYFHREKQGDNLAVLSRTELKSKARGIQKSYVSYTQRCDTRGIAFCQLSIDVMWWLHKRFGVNFYGQPPESEN